MKGRMNERMNVGFLKDHICSSPSGSIASLQNEMRLHRLLVVPVAQLVVRK
jgi:hypothetical protein